MPTRHINDKTWREVEKQTVKIVVATQKSVKEVEVLNLLIKKGLEAITEEDYQELTKK